MTPEWYATPCHPKMNRHTKFGDPTSNNTGYMHRTQCGTKMRLLHASQSSFGRGGRGHKHQTCCQEPLLFFMPFSSSVIHLAEGEGECKVLNFNFTLALTTAESRAKIWPVNVFKPPATWDATYVILNYLLKWVTGPF